MRVSTRSKKDALIILNYISICYSKLINTNKILYIYMILWTVYELGMYILCVYTWTLERERDNMSSLGFNPVFKTSLDC